MLVPLSWLREFAPTDLGAEKLAELISRRGVKVEAILRPWDGLDGVIVARVVDVQDHPNADKLCLARIQHVDGETTVVVGVRNMRPGDLVPWAPAGARVPALPAPIERRTIRGVESDGMLCSSRELAIAHDHEGILLLNDEGLDVGVDMKSALGLDDPVLDIEVEPNRPDFLSVFGVAREVASATGVPLIEPDLELAEGPDRASDTATVAVEAFDACPRYLARVIRGLTHRPSPLQAQTRLTAAGMRPIDAVVDATNYVMLELGQPLHGFDMDRLAGPGIVVRMAKDGERLSTLDDVERELTERDLVICDLERPVALAGVMGGRTSEVSEATTNVLLESAWFARGGILLTARRLALHTEASHRFERGTDPEGVDRAARRCAQLLARWAGGEVLAGVAQVGGAPPRHHVTMRASRAAALLGYPVTPTEAQAVFETLNVRARVQGDVVDVEVPGYRTDVEHEVDLIEEVLRVQGYDRVGSRLPRAPHPGGVPAEYAFARRAKGALRGLGLHEIRPAPFADAEELAAFDDRDAIAVANPLRAEEGFLRTRLTPGLLRAVARNRDLGVERVAVFEVGVTFRLDDPFVEVRKAGFALTGSAGEGWAAERRELDVLDAKGVLSSLLEELGVADWTLGEVPPGPFHPARSATVIVEDRSVGVLGEVHPKALERAEIEGRVAVGVVGLGSLMRAAGRAFTFREPARFPPVRRDLSFVVAKDVPAGDLRATLEQAAGELFDSSELIDVYHGAPLSSGTKSLTYRLELRSAERTLTDEDARAAVDAAVRAASERLGAELRSG
jgi:phenylalanyl-tRNA synthetase beta chain